MIAVSRLEWTAVLLNTFLVQGEAIFFCNIVPWCHQTMDDVLLKYTLFYVIYSLIISQFCEYQACLC